MSFNKCIQSFPVQNQLVADKTPNGDNITKSSQGVIQKKISSKNREINEVEELNPHMVPYSRSTDIPEKLNMKRKAQHEVLIKKLADDLNKLNLKIEENIRISSEEVKAHMNAYKDELNEMLKSLNIPEVASYHESVFLNIQQKANGMKSHQLKLVQDLYESLCKMESLRSKENEKIFHESFQNIEKAAYLFPYEIQTFIEHETLKMNQLMLNNRRCYEDLKLKLVLITEQTYKSFIDEVFCIKEKWIHLNADKGMNSPKESEHAQIRKPSLPEPQKRLELKNHELPLHLTEDKCFSILKLENWFANVKDVVKAIGIYAKSLADTQRRVLKAVQKGLSNDFDDVRRCTLSLDAIQFEERVTQPISLETTLEEGKNFDSLESSWQNVLLLVKTDLECVVSILSDFGELWTRHIERLCESKILVLKAAEKSDENDRLALQELEVKFNLNMDSLRQEFSPEKMEGLHNAVVASLDEIKDKIELNFINETSITENFYKMMDLEADVLASEIKEFASIKFVRTADNFEQDFDKYVKQIQDLRTTSIKHMKEFSSLICSVAALNSEIQDALKALSERTREKLSWKAEHWVQARIEEVSRKYQIQLEVHNKRYERVRSQVYDVRLNEIKLHQTVFDQHKAGLNAVYEKLTRSVDGLYEEGIQKIEKCRLKIDLIVESAKKEQKAAAVKCVQMQIQREKVSFKTDLVSHAEAIRGEIDINITAIQQSNLKFMKSIRLFHEGGNYDADEAKMYVTSLEGFDKDINNEVKALMKEVNKKEADLVQRSGEVFDKTLRTLSQLHDELQFHSDVINVIRTSENVFLEAAADVRRDMDMLSEEADYASVCTDNEANRLSVEQDELWARLVKLVYKNVGNLFYGLELPHLPESTSEETEGNSAISEKAFLSDKRKEEAVGVARAEHSCRDLREELFAMDLSAEGSPKLMSAVYVNCLQNLNRVQTLACAFYKNTGNRALIRTDLIRASYDEFDSEALEVFRVFALRSEVLWLRTVLEFLPILCRIKTSFRSYFKRRIFEYAESVISALTAYEMDFLNSFNENGCCLVNELQSLDRRLLPLHGYPQNQHLLASLEEDVVQKTAELDLSWEIFIKKYKINLKQFHAEHVTDNREWQRLRRIYLSYREALFTEALADDLLSFTRAVLHTKGLVKKVENSKTAQDFLCATVAEASSAEKLTSVSELQQAVEVCLTEMAELLDDHTRGGPSDESTDHVMIRGNAWASMTQGLLQQADDFDELCKPLSTRMETRYREVKGVVQSKTSFQKEIIFGWLDRWKSNVGKIAELFTVKYVHRDEASEGSSESAKARVAAMLKTIKSKPKKTSASTTSTLPKLSQNPANNKTMQTDKKAAVTGSKRAMSNTSLGSVSPGKRHRQIPVPSRYFMNSQRVAAQSKRITDADVTSPKANVSGGRCATKQTKRTSNSASAGSKSPSSLPVANKHKLNADRLACGKQRPLLSKAPVGVKGSDRTALPTASPRTKKSAESSVNCTNSYTTITLSSPRAEESDTPALDSPTQESPGKSSTYASGETSPKDRTYPCASASVSKSSLGCDFDLEPCTKLGECPGIADENAELLRLSIKDSESQVFSTVPGSAATTPKSSDSHGLGMPQSIIRTLSGDDLVLSSSIEFETENVLRDETDETIERLLKDVENDGLAFAGVHVLEDDANEYDSEETTDVDAPPVRKMSSQRSERGLIERAQSKVDHANELLTDVSYRQFVYHPTVLRRRTREERREERQRPRSKSIEDRSSSGPGDPDRERGSGSKSCFKKKNLSQSFVSNRDVNITPLRTRCEKPQEEDREIYDHLSLMQNSDYVLKEIKRERSKRERITGAILRLTAKFIHLLAILNLWPGDNCQLLTSRSLHYGR